MGIVWVSGSEVTLKESQTWTKAWICLFLSVIVQIVRIVVSMGKQQGKSGIDMTTDYEDTKTWTCAMDKMTHVVHMYIANIFQNFQCFLWHKINAHWFLPIRDDHCCWIISMETQRGPIVYTSNFPQHLWYITRATLKQMENTST